MSARVAVIIPAGGSGRRMGGVPKAFLPLAGRPLLEHTLAPFRARADIIAIVVPLPAALAAAPPAWLLEDTRVVVVTGGVARAHSVRIALEQVPPGADIILVHDAARPLVTAALIERTIAATAAGASVCAAVPVVDTIQEVDAARRIVGTPDRSGLWQAQTPQAFPAEVLRHAHARAAEQGVVATDDATLVHRYGGVVAIVEGAVDNLKLTTPLDVQFAEFLLRQRA